LALVAAYVLWEMRGLPMGTASRPGPAYVPVFLAVACAALGALIAIQDRRGQPLQLPTWREARFPVAISCAGAFAALALERLGYRLTLFALLFVMFRVVERKGTWSSLFAAAAAAAGTHWLFAELLGVQLPRGPLGL